MKPKNAIIANYHLEKISKNTFYLHYLGDGWHTVKRTKKQVEQSDTFFELFINF